jgi:hypothetical protein
MQRFSMLARHVISLVALAIALMTFGTASMVTSTAAPSAQKPAAGELTSTVTGVAEGGHDVTAEFIPKKFKKSEDGLAVRGWLVGTIEGVGDFKKMRTFEVSSINDAAVPSSDTKRSDFALAATCDILFLELGPLDLDLLGLVVHLDKIVLDIDAESGPGNLLGNLLCAVVGLLDQGGPLNNLLNQLINLLNQILGQLGGLSL